ncbi:hypothetical protein BFP97_03810 [Roseivirga sp. 4D4]|nr:hypothetical protein BFP97_03810 [Roseivirga sp. 4D4]
MGTNAKREFKENPPMIEEGEKVLTLKHYKSDFSYHIKVLTGGLKGKTGFVSEFDLCSEEDIIRKYSYDSSLVRIDYGFTYDKKVNGQSLLSAGDTVISCGDLIIYRETVERYKGKEYVQMERYRDDRKVPFGTAAVIISEVQDSRNSRYFKIKLLEGKEEEYIVGRTYFCPSERVYAQMVASKKNKAKNETLYRSIMSELGHTRNGLLFLSLSLIYSIVLWILTKLSPKLDLLRMIERLGRLIRNFLYPVALALLIYVIYLWTALQDGYGGMIFMFIWLIAPAMLVFALIAMDRNRTETLSGTVGGVPARFSRVIGSEDGDPDLGIDRAYNTMAWSLVLFFIYIPIHILIYFGKIDSFMFRDIKMALDDTIGMVAVAVLSMIFGRLITLPKPLINFFTFFGRGLYLNYFIFLIIWGLEVGL